MTSRRFAGIVSLLLILLFVYTAGSKLADYDNFQFGLSESPYIASYAGMLAWAIPGVELLIVALLLFPSFRLTGLYASFVLMLLFTLYIAAMLLSGMDIPCSCGGVLEEMSWSMHIVFNSVFVVLSAIAIILETKQRRQVVKLAG